MSSSKSAVSKWFDDTVVELVRQFRWSYLPPLMVYFAAGVSGITSIVGAFFVKDYLHLSAAFLAGLGFWAGIPWALKMPLGHLVDLIWRWKHFLVYLGATIIATSILIVYGLIRFPDEMARIMAPETWFVISVLLSPTGYVIQDTVADAMTVEAVPVADAAGVPFSESQTKQMHTTMQTLGRVAIISGVISVAALNIGMFSDVQTMTETMKLSRYATIYGLALLIPVISVAGVSLGIVMSHYRKKSLISSGISRDQADATETGNIETTVPDYRILGGGLLFVALTVGIAVLRVPFSQEIVFLGSLVIVSFLIRQLISELAPSAPLPVAGYSADHIRISRGTPCRVPGRHGGRLTYLGLISNFYRC